MNTENTIPDLITSADLRDCWTDRQIATMANRRHRERMAEVIKERDELREENARLREALEKSKEFVQSWGELIDTQYPLWNECMTTIQKALPVQPSITP